MKSAGITLLCLAVSAAAQSTGAQYSNWLNEDVTYIITDTERSAFVSLQTDTERDRFIEQFWLRRDPTPDTIENEFRDEHYRRIAYANEYFGSSRPGWRTDRGRIYITYGAPDEIDGHPSSQVWRYRLINGVGTNVTIEFVDSTGSGDFHMTMNSGPEPKAEVYTTDAAQTMMEQMGMSDKTQLFNGDSTHSAAPIIGQPERLPELTPAPATPITPPKIRFTDLEAKINWRITTGLLPMRVRVDFFPVTRATVLTYVSAQFENKDLQLSSSTDGVRSAHFRMFGEITTLDRQVVEIFEKDIPIPGAPREYLADWGNESRLARKPCP